MYLEKLQVHGIRNIVKADLALSPTVNLFHGLNGSGKTSLLEAVHILSRGRSFRTRNLKSVINLDEKSCTCFGLVRSATDLGQGTPVGVMRDSQGEFVFKVDGRQVHTASRLAEVLPVQIVNADSFQILEGAPGVRRSFIDWGVFHVEHQYRDRWSRFQKCLRHRNSLLRHGRIDRLQLAVWDREFCLLADQIDESRRSYLDTLVTRLTPILRALGFEQDVDFRYVSGWDRDQGLANQLADAWQRDQKAGFSHFGPHRADLKIQLGRQQAADILSRGQIKALVFALKLAQGQVFKETTGQGCIFLLDDLPSELDGQHRRAVCQLLVDMGVQVLVTGVEEADLVDMWPAPGDDAAVFHVEQGQVGKIGIDES